MGFAGDPQAVREVTSGRRTVAYASWWGFDPIDATASIQAAIDSGAPKVIVPYVARPWIVTPIKLRSNLELVFEPGVVVLAKKGEFKGKSDSMFSATEAENIIVRGYGATLRMRKKDYQGSGYSKAEWRMVLAFRGCRRMRVEGLRLESSGGDGIYIGTTRQVPYCADVVIRDVVCHDNHRQGISVIGAVNLLIENCVLSGTEGTAPQAGIDFEPDGPRERLVNCVMRNCIIEDNAGAGIQVYLKQLSRESEPVSIRVEDCYVRSGRGDGIAVGAVADGGPQGLIEFRNCTIENTRQYGLCVYDKSADGVRLRFVNCKWNNVATSNRLPGKDKTGAPLLVTVLKPERIKKNGGIDFIDCAVYDRRDRPVLLAEDAGADIGVHDLKGSIRVWNPFGARMGLVCRPFDVDLNLIESGRR